ncbi:MAG: polyprenyl synthetase family protein [Rhodothermaceae bacterium]|nr:polyprenyl synthetase family protein [Rhodothermaceae bacterium]
MHSTTDKLTQLIENAIGSIPIPDEPESLYKPLRYALGLGGKRIRPRLTLLGCGLNGGTIEDAIPAAMSVELLHNFTLIHDDIMDRADSRRGSPTVHARWNQSVAILSGDVLFAIAYDQLNTYGTDNHYTKEQYHHLHQLFYDAVRIVCEGQAMDLDFEDRTEVSIDEYLHMISGKTAQLLSCSLQMGAVVAGAGKEQVDDAGVVGMEAGIAFQIQDDLLDAIGDPDKFGKKVGGDIFEGKKTWLSILALQKAGRVQKSELLRILQLKENSQDEVNKVINLYFELGVIDEAQKAVEVHYLNAISHLDKFAGSLFKDEIKALLNQLKTRDK